MISSTELIVFVLLIDTAFCAIGLRCDMIPEGVTSPRYKEDLGRYKIDISGDPDSYVPGEQYTVFIRSEGSSNDQQHKFTHFILSIVNEKFEQDIESESSVIGALQLYGDSFTKFSDSCQNAVVQADSQPKTEIQVLWMAPSKGSGCIKMKATVVESVDTWFSEEGQLTKVLCEESHDTEDTQPRILKQCCTCDEAKYEIIFEGLWSRNTHPKDFPTTGRPTRFSDIIGASHTGDYTFWSYGDAASEGLRQLAEHGNTRMLESELKAKSDHIRTIIKARGISHPNITGKTFAVFRVDNRHHLVSLVSMIDPSPDWIVGVSSLELCLRNCSWIEAKVVNLYPWDVGTDDGITYLSPNQPSSPRLPIRRVKTNVPNDSRSPFYDVTNTPMKPFARLTLTRQRLYEKSCDATLKEETEDDAACETEAWSSWSPCSVTCGRGIKYKQRRYKHEDSKFSCHKKLTDRSSCEAVQKYCPHKLARQFEDPLCELGPWSEWSSCSVTCGKGTMTRDRKYKNRLAAKTCAAGKAKSGILQQNLECWGEGDCEDSEERISEDCPKKPWSDWSPCSVTCGRGYKERYRLSLDHKSVRTKYWPLHDTYKSKSMEEFDEDDPCNNFKTKETVECYENECQERHHQNVSIMACGLPKDPGSCKSSMDKWYFDTLKGRCEIFAYSGCAGNLNNFNTLEQCQTLCSKYQKEMLVNSTILKKELGISVSGVLTYNIQNDANAQPSSTNTELDDGDDFRPQTDTPKVDCDVSKWSNWGSCIVESGDCGIGHKEKFRVILRLPKNGGHPCPEVLLKRKKCRISCKAQTNEASDFKDNKIDTSCIMSSWFPWSACGEKCEMKYQYRIRYAVATPGSEEYECEDEVQRRRCDCG